MKKTICRALLCLLLAACLLRPLRGPGRPPWGRADRAGCGRSCWGWACLMDRLIFPSGETERIFTVTSCPSVR